MFLSKEARGFPPPDGSWPPNRAEIGIDVDLALKARVTAIFMDFETIFASIWKIFEPRNCQKLVQKSIKLPHRLRHRFFPILDPKMVDFWSQNHPKSIIRRPRF